MSKNAIIQIIGVIILLIGFVCSLVFCFENVPIAFKIDRCVWLTLLCIVAIIRLIHEEIKSKRTEIDELVKVKEKLEEMKKNDLL